VYTNAGTDELRAFGYITADEQSLLEEVLLTGTPVDDIFPYPDDSGADRGVFHVDRSGTVLRASSEKDGTHRATVGFLCSDTVEATVEETVVPGKFTVSVGTRKKNSVKNILLSRDFPEDAEDLLDRSQTLGKRPCTVSVYGMCREISVVNTPDPRRDHFMTMISGTDSFSSTFNIGGTVTSVRQERNSLTGGSWYRIGLNSTLPVTLAAGDEERVVPKVGDVIHVEAELYFSRTLPLIDPPTLTHGSGFTEPSSDSPGQHSDYFAPLHEQEGDDEDSTDDSPFTPLAHLYSVPESIVREISSKLILAGLSVDFLEEVVQEISYSGSFHDTDRSQISDLTVSALRAIDCEDEALRLARKIFENEPSYISFTLLMECCHDRSERFVRQEITWVDYLITHEACPDAGLIRSSEAFQLPD